MPRPRGVEESVTQKAPNDAQTGFSSRELWIPIKHPVDRDLPSALGHLERQL